MPRNSPEPRPNNSIPIIVQAIGVCVAPANTATNPIPARSEIGSGSTNDKALPRVVPIKNRGVTSPPLNPQPKVKLVKAILSKKAYQWLGESKALTIVGTPKPSKGSRLKLKKTSAKRQPPTKGRIGA